jgi:Skp family chaperone for outer membrane proteins
MNSIDVKKLLENIQTIANHLNISIHIEPNVQPKLEISMEATIKAIEKEYIDMHTEYKQKWAELDDKLAALNDEINNLTSERAALNNKYLDQKIQFQNRLRALFIQKTTMSLDTINKFLNRKIDWFDATL